jgi:hypothetical protein
VLLAGRSQQPALQARLQGEVYHSGHTCCNRPTSTGIIGCRTPLLLLLLLRLPSLQLLQTAAQHLHLLHLQHCRRLAQHPPHLLLPHMTAPVQPATAKYSCQTRCCETRCCWHLLQLPRPRQCYSFVGAMPASAHLVSPDAVQHLCRHLQAGHAIRHGARQPIKPGSSSSRGRR